MSTGVKYKSQIHDELRMLQNLNEPVLILQNSMVIYSNRSAANLFGYKSWEKMINLRLADITSTFEKKSVYPTMNTSGFLAGEDGRASSRFRWIHKKKDGSHFYSEVIIIKLPVHLKRLYPDSLCVIITDLNDWSITKQVAEKNLQSSQNLINNIYQPILIIDPNNGQIVDCNVYASQFYGYTISQLNGMKISDINTLDEKKIIEEMEKAKSERRGHFLFKHKLANGRIIDVKVLSGPIQYQNKTMLYSVITKLDTKIEYSKIVSHNRKSTAEQNLFEYIFHNIEIPAAIFNPDMRVRVVNSAFLREFEYKVTDVMNHHISPLICPWEYIEEAEFYHKLVLQGNNIDEQVLRRSQSGHVKSYRVNAFPLIYNDSVSAVTAFYIDVDAERKAFFKLNLINKIFENIDEGMLITDPNSKIIWVNEALELITGYGSEELIGETPKIMQSGREHSVFYDQMWQKLKNVGSWEGEVYNRKKDGTVYQVWLTIVAVKDRHDNVINYIGVLNDITKFKAQEERIMHLAKIDPLTGLMNRATFLENAENELRGTPETIRHAILFIDLDDFKKINDIYGHDQGDHLLKIIAYRLNSAFKMRDVIGRIGGDEFIVLLKDVEPHQIDDIVDRLKKVLERTIELENHMIKVNVSVGISVYPDDALTLTELMKNADIALYTAKETKGSSSSYFSEDIKKQFNYENKMEACLKHAIERSEFTVYYQGIISTKNEKFRSAEALLRWNSEALGVISPSVFIPVAERMGLMPQIGYWVIESVLNDIKRWELDTYLKDGIAVNISVAQLEEEGFSDKVKALFESTGISPHKVEFEITESVYIKDFEKVVDSLEKLHALGIRFTMDDFGTGYSSLAVIHRLKLSKIKIDRSFIKDLPQHDKSIELTKSIINLARNLNFRVVAEGVEHEDQVAFLKLHNCDYIQGYYFCKPLEGQDFLTLLKEV